jgi:hypothetical protein|tara:strand:- start:192 stop:428 length:237 start_codon:yes stop_codon:yes gene_type:complete
VSFINEISPSELFQVIDMGEVAFTAILVVITHSLCIFHETSYEILLLSILHLFIRSPVIVIFALDLYANGSLEFITND